MSKIDKEIEAVIGGVKKGQITFKRIQIVTTCVQL